MRFAELAVIAALMFASGCSGRTTPVPSTLPTAPIVVAQPQSPPKLSEQSELDLSKMSVPQLVTLRDQLLTEHQTEQACQVWQWSIQNGGEGRYNLACLYAQNGKVEDAFYYLLEAAAKEGVDPDHAQDDPDLMSLRKDGRWRKVRGYLRQVSAYWAAQPLLRTKVVLPRQGSPKFLVIGLHGMGGNEGFVDESYQDLADKLQAAFLGVSGTVPLGPTAFRWSEDWSKDQLHLEKAIASQQEKLEKCSNTRVVFGFSQGAQTAFALAGRDPAHYRGALLFSPGAFGEATPSAVGPQQRFLIRVGAKESPFTLRFAQKDAERARQAGASVDYYAYPNICSHSFPPDFSQKFPDWLAWIAQPR